MMYAGNPYPLVDVHICAGDGTYMWVIHMLVVHIYWKHVNAGRW